MNLSMKQNSLAEIKNRLVVAKGERLGVEWSGRLGLASKAFIHRMEKQQGPAV